MFGNKLSQDVVRIPSRGPSRSSPETKTWAPFRTAQQNTRTETRRDKRWRISTSFAEASSRGGRVCERKCVRRSTLVRTRSKKFCRLNARFYSSLNAEDTVESATRTFPSPESDSWPVSRPFINEEATIEVGPCVGVPANDSEVKKGKECSPLNANAIRTSRTLLHPYADECGGYTSYPA